MKKAAFVLCLMMVSAPPAAAVPVTEFKSITAADRKAVNAEAQKIFDQLAAKGTTETFTAVFTELGAKDSLSPEILEQFAKLDEMCGKLTSAERITSADFGSKVVRDTYVSQHGNCLVKWDITFIKIAESWSFSKVNFLTYDGNDWKP